jgi:amino acid adenylation domain-containing protein
VPADHARPAQADLAGGVLDVEIDADLTTALRTLSGHAGTTLYMTLLAAWSALLSRLSNQQDLLVGSPSANRSRPEIEPLIGLFINTLVMRINLSGSPSTLELLTQVKEQVIAAQENQDVPFEQIVDLLVPQRSLAFHPLVQVMFSLGSATGLRIELSGLEAESTTAGTYRASKFDLSLALQEQDSKISGSLEFATALFEHSTIQRYWTYFLKLLGGMTATPHHAVASLPLLCGVESSLLLGVWSGTEAALPAGCAHEWFEEHARRTPEATALEFGQEQLSYGELNRRANQLAHHLRALGVQPDDRVAVCLERGFAMLVSLLAVLKAGGAYVPLDPAYPPDRLRFALQDAAPRLWISQQAIATALFADEQDASSAPRLLRFEDRSSPWEQPAWDHNFDPEAVGLQPHHLAYLIYTSGSTGQPKGVMVEHRQLSARLAGVRQNLACTAGDHMPVVSSPGFDISLLETLLPLISGGVARLTDAQRIKQMPYLLAETRTATLFNAVTSLMEAWSHSLPPQQQIRQHYPALRTLLVGGEPVSQRLLNQLIAQFPEAHIVQTYGPTEATLYCTSGIATPSQDTTVRPPIGRPLPNTRIYILDAHRQLVPVGVSGEIFIGGASVARGYLNQPDLTAERFLHDPFSPHPQARMYRSGDLGRWLPDGSIEFIGRNDSQVKIRGFRIELGEIEAQLARHPKVQDADVIAREDRPGEKRLVAYLVPKDHANPPAVDSLHTLLAAALPEHMVPAAYVILPARPLSPNGKLDRNALPAPDRNAFDTEEFQPPQGEIEQKIAEIWKDLLGIQRIGRKDNFFQIGGHSLLAISLIERLRQQNLQIDIRTLFATPTLQRLAQSASLRKILPIPKNRIPNENTLAEDEVEITI